MQGFTWCRNAPQTIGIAGLTAKILCDHHNSTLSPVDDEGGRAFSVFREMMRLSNVRKNLAPRLWNKAKHRINGPLFERWLLKTLINISTNGSYPIGRDSTTAGRVSDELVRIAYGLSHFDERAGLYFVVRTGMQINSVDTVGFTPLIKDGTRIEGGLFSFRGFRFLLYLEKEGPPSRLDGILFDGEELSSSQLNFHNRRIDEYAGAYLSQILTIDWP